MADTAFIAVTDFFAETARNAVTALPEGTGAEALTVFKVAGAVADFVSDFF